MDSKRIFILITTVCLMSGGLSIISSFGEAEAANTNPEMIAPDGAIYGYETFMNKDDSFSRLLEYTPGEDSTVYLRSALEGYVLTELGDESFKNCSSIEKIIIPKNVRYIGHEAFSDCGNLSVYFLGSFPQIENDTFLNTDVTLYKSTIQSEGWPSSTENMDYRVYAGENCSFEYLILDGEITVYYHIYGTVIEIPDEIDGIPVTRIGQSAFEEKYGDKTNEITSLRLGKNVVKISDRAFYDCNKLKTANIPNGVVYIDDEAFRQCYVMEDVKLPGTLKYLGFESFRMCHGFKDIVIPDSVTTIEGGAFYDCNNAETLYISNNVELLSERAFGYCSNLKKATVPNSVTEMEHSTFYNCRSMESVNLGENVKTIGDWSFYQCESLKEVRFGESLEYLGIHCFEKCACLDDVHIPNSMISIGEYAFSECDSLKDVSFGSSLDSIGKRAFTACKSLTEVVLPESLCSVGDYAFFGCTALKKAVFEGECPEFGQKVFDKTDSLFIIEFNSEHENSWADFSLYDAEPIRTEGTDGKSSFNTAILATVSVLAIFAIIVLVRRIGK